MCPVTRISFIWFWNSKIKLELQEAINRFQSQPSKSTPHPASQTRRYSHLLICSVKHCNNSLHVNQFGKMQESVTFRNMLWLRQLKTIFYLFFAFFLQWCTDFQADQSLTWESNTSGKWLRKAYLLHNLSKFFFAHIVLSLWLENIMLSQMTLDNCANPTLCKTGETEGKARSNKSVDMKASNEWMKEM